MILEEKLKQRIISRFVATRSYPRRNAIDDIVTEEPFKFSKEWAKTFLKAMRYCFEQHYNNSEFYRKLCVYKSFTKDRLKSFEDIWDIPFILSDVFKQYTIETKTRDFLRAEFTSTGTSGKKSKIMVDITSGQRLLFMSYHIYRVLGLAAENMPTNYLMMAYNPRIASTLGTTNSDVIISTLTPRKEVHYALDRGKSDDIEFLKDESIEKLREFIVEGDPIRILGFLHHACEVIKGYNKKYGRVEFPPNSYILSGGGWKTFAHLYGPAFNLLKFLENRTTIDRRNIRDLYTLTEHAVFYAECEEHNMHIPNVSLVGIRDPRTLKILPHGKTGLVHLYTPLIESSPVLSLLTTDYGYMGKACSCRLKGPYLKIIGRAGVTKKGTCALTADQYIKRDDKKGSDPNNS